MNYLGGNKFEEETLKKEICSQLSVFSQVDLKDAAEKLLSFLTKNEITDILTTNYYYRKTPNSFPKIIPKRFIVFVGIMSMSTTKKQSRFGKFTGTQQHLKVLCWD